MNRLITLLAASAGAAGLAATAAAQEGELRPNVLQQLPADVLEGVIDAPDTSSDADPDWSPGRPAGIGECLEPEIVVVERRHVGVACRRDSPPIRDWTGLAAYYFVKRFDYPDGACPDGSTRGAPPSEACSALWARVDARRAEFIDRMVHAIENDWRIEFRGEAEGSTGPRAELVSYTLSRPR